MISFTTQLYDPIYAKIGVAAELTTPGNVVKSLTVCDMGKGQSLALGGDARHHIGGGVHVETMTQTVRVRAAELSTLGLTAATDLDEGTLSFSGATWRVVTHQVIGSPNGAGDGEIALMLQDEGLS